MNVDSGAEHPPKRILDHQKSIREIEFREKIAEFVCLIFLVLATAVPLWIVYLCVDSISGKSTHFEIKLGLLFSVTVGGAGIVALIAWLKNRSQKKEILRLRTRVAELESRLGL